MAGGALQQYVAAVHARLIEVEGGSIRSVVGLEEATHGSVFWSSCPIYM